jgi:type III secretion system FlhB-like substrate exporter
MILPPGKSKASLLAVLFMLIVSAVNSLSVQAKSLPQALDELHGGIEIGSKGVKAIALRIAGEADNYSVKIIYAEVVNTTLAQTKDGNFTPAAIHDTVNAVQRFHQRMRQEYRIPAEQIHVVVSSGVIGKNSQELSAEIAKITGQTPPFLDVDTEVQLTIAGAVPKRYKSGQTWQDNRSISVLIDVGSGNTKGGYQQLRQVTVGSAGYDYVTWGIPKGTITFFNEINNAAGESADYKTFVNHSAALAKDSIRSPLRSEAARKPGLLNRRKVYLSGGIVWAMATLLHPENRQSFTPLTVDDINTFYNRATTNPEALLDTDLSRIANATLRQEAEREVETVRNTFTPKNLIAGAEILRAVAVEMNLTGKRMYFARYGHLAWILSYVRLQAER